MARPLGGRARRLRPEPDHARRLQHRPAGRPNYQAFTSSGLRPPEELDGLPRTTSDLPGKASYYDQIAWFRENGRSKLSFDYTGRAGHFQWTKHLLTEVEGEAKTFRISDHYPLWSEFSIRPT